MTRSVNETICISASQLLPLGPGHGDRPLEPVVVEMFYPSAFHSHSERNMIEERAYPWLDPHIVQDRSL
jgi:hypothetical protein